MSHFIIPCHRPGRAGVNATGRGVLSMSGLSFGVVRVDQENSLTSLTLQDCGQVMPGCEYRSLFLQQRGLGISRYLNLTIVIEIFNISNMSYK